MILNFGGKRSKFDLKARKWFCRTVALFTAAGYYQTKALQYISVNKMAVLFT